MVFKKRVYLTRPTLGRVFSTPPPTDCFAIADPGTRPLPHLTRPTLRDFSPSRPACQDRPIRKDGALYPSRYARFRRRPDPPGHNSSSGLATNTDE